MPIFLRKKVEGAIIRGSAIFRGNTVYVITHITSRLCQSHHSLFIRCCLTLHNSGGSRISCRGGMHPLAGSVDLRHGHFLVKMYAKMKELGPIGEGVRPARPPPLDPPMHKIKHFKS